MKSEQIRSFVRGAASLGRAGRVCKGSGALFRIPLYNLLEDGMAYYEAVYPYYSWLLVVSSAGIPTAISRMVAERVAMGDHAGARRVFHRAQALLVGIGLVTTLIMFFGAGWFASLVEVGEGVVLSFRALAPALLFVSVMCAYRGYLQGLQCMSGTAVSQLVEQVVKLVAGLFFAAKLLPMGLEYAAMGALLGISRSEAASEIFINACNEVQFLENVGGRTRKPSGKKKNAADKEEPLDTQELNKILCGILDEQTDKDELYASELKGILLRLRPDFNEKSFGCATFSKL